MLDTADWALVPLAIVFLVAYGWPILQPTLAPWAKHVCNIVQWAAWAVFALDFVLRVAVARHRWQYFTRHLLDFAIVALSALPALRPVRLIILFRVINRKAAATLRGQVALYVVISTATLVVSAALAVLSAERGAHGANITSFGDALWWAMVTITTVGYGDQYPVTPEGRFIAVGLMIAGIALIGVVTASFAAWFIDRVRVEEAEAQAATRRDLEAVMARLDTVTEELTALRRSAEEREKRAELSPPGA